MKLTHFTILCQVIPSVNVLFILTILHLFHVHVVCLEHINLEYVQSYTRIIKFVSFKFVLEDIGKYLDINIFPQCQFTYS